MYATTSQRFDYDTIVNDAKASVIFTSRLGFIWNIKGLILEIVDWNFDVPFVDQEQSVRATVNANGTPVAYDKLIINPDKEADNPTRWNASLEDIVIAEGSSIRADVVYDASHIAASKVNNVGTLRAYLNYSSERATAAAVAPPIPTRPPL